MRSGSFFLHPNIAKLYGETIRDRGEREDKFADLVQAALAFQQGRVKLPQSLLSITPDIAEHLPDLALPTAQVFVLSAARTFWQKATLIHVELHRPSLRPSAERLSCQWYDLSRLADHEVRQQAMGDSELLRDVLRIKETFYCSGFSHYDPCIAGGLRLIPDEQLLDALRQDYQAMLAAQMFYGDALEFETIVERLRDLEQKINRTHQKHT